MRTYRKSALPARLIDSGGGAAARVASVDELRIGCNQPLPPLIEERDGRIGGFEPELARVICAGLDWRAAWIYRPFPDLPELLEAGEIDCIMWNFVATVERAARFALTRPYGGTDMALLVRRDAQIAGIDDLAGRTVGAVRATTNLEQARRLPHGPSVVTYDPGLKVLGRLVEDLLEGTIDAALDDEVPFRALIARTPGLRIAGTIPTQSRYVIAFQRDDAIRRDIVDAVLARLVASGHLARLWERHVGAPLPVGFG